jgi:hypothetical protein
MPVSSDRSGVVEAQANQIQSTVDRAPTQLGHEKKWAW